MHTCGIIEDEYLARRLLVKYIKQFGDLELLWASETILNPGLVAKVDIVFLDLLDVPSTKFGISEGINEFVSHFPNIIITTAYPAEYVRRIGLLSAQILTKPYTYPAFVAAVTTMLHRPQ